MIRGVRREIVVPLAENAKPPRTSIGAFFAHPATLLLVAGVITALLSGLLVPSVTRRWQNHDKELERRSAILHEELGVKSRLVNLIGEASANFLGASQLRAYVEPSPATGLGKYDRAYVRWSISSAKIASELAAYFRPRSKPARRWRNFSHNMRNTYFLVRDQRGDEREHWLDEVNAYLTVNRKRLNDNRKLLDGIIFARPVDRPVKRKGDEQRDRPGTSRNQTYEAALRTLVQQIQNKEASVVNEIVDAKSALRTSEE